MPMLYLSETKIQALEDCILYFPTLFRLTKSIVVSEPILEAAGLSSDITSEIQLTLRADK